MNPQSVKVVAFDCDGVLFDSSRANQAYYDHILRQFDLPPMTQAQFAYAHMHTVDETLSFLIRDPHMLAAAQQYRRQMSYQPFIRHMAMEPHLRVLLTKLRPTYKTAIATNRTDTMAGVLRTHRLADAFDLVVTARDVQHPKPHPEQLWVILKHFHIAPAAMIYIGDSELDALAARQAGVPFIAFQNAALCADLHIDSLQQVSGFLGL